MHTHTTYHSHTCAVLLPPRITVTAFGRPAVTEGRLTLTIVWRILRDQHQQLMGGWRPVEKMGSHACNKTQSPINTSARINVHPQCWWARGVCACVRACVCMCAFLTQTLVYTCHLLLLPWTSRLTNSSPPGLQTLHWTVVRHHYSIPFGVLHNEIGTHMHTSLRQYIWATYITTIDSSLLPYMRRVAGIHHIHSMHNNCLNVKV